MVTAPTHLQPTKKPYCDIRIWKNIKYEYAVNQTEGRRPFLPAISGDIGDVDNYLVYRMYPHYVCIYIYTLYIYLIHVS